MKFWEIFRFEFAYQVRRIWTWLIFAALLIIAYLMTRDNSLSEALFDDFFINSPFAIAKTTVVGSLMWLMGAAVIAGEAAARDVATGMYPLTYTATVGKGEYVGGRFLAAFLINAVLLLAVQVGILIAVYAPGVDAALIGPFRPAAYLTAYGFLALPNALVATAIQFSLATRAGRPMAGYLGSLLLFFMSYIVSIFLLFQGRQDLANLFDPIGVHFILSELSHLWTTVEKSWRLIELEGTVLRNRLLWLGIASIVIAITFLLFRFTHRNESNWLKGFFRKRMFVDTPMSTGIAVTERTLISVPNAARTFGFAANGRQVATIAWTSFRIIAKSWAGRALLFAIPLMTVLVVMDQMSINGVPLLPMTGRVLAELTAPLSAETSRWVIVPLIVLFFAGELVWREREAGLGEITDTMPGSDWAPFLGKFLGLGLVLALFLAILMMAGILAQVLMGYHDFQVGLYLKTLFGLQLPEYLLFALFAIVVHVLVNQKYIGHLVAIIAYIFITLASLFGVEHNLLIYGAAPTWSYTDMSGFGPSIGPWLWFKLYWAAWALLLAVLARLLWVRGKETGLRTRLQLARRRFTRSTAITGSLSIALIIGLGGFIFYNTNVLNKYESASEMKDRGADYERRFGKYRNIAQPRINGIRLHIEIYPGDRAVDIRGSYGLINRSEKSIDSIFVATIPGVETSAIAFNRTTTLLVDDDVHHQRIYKMKDPLQPGDSVQLNFEVQVKPRGFRENGVDLAVVANGTYFTKDDWLPAIGYQQGRELSSPNDRRALALPPRRLIASLYDVEARKDRGELIDFEAIIGTDENQVAVAPGLLRETWNDSSRSSARRRYFRYSTDSPIGNEQFFFSARYAVREAEWKDSMGSGQTVGIKIYYDPKHTANVDRMVQSARASLDYYTSQFGPYEYEQITFVEHPGDGDGAGIHAVRGMLICEEGFSFWDPGEGPGSLDHPFAVVAHEMAHQWTVPSASVEGAPVLSESLAWYYAMKLLEKAKGAGQLELLRRFMRSPHPHPPIRRGEPLLQGLDPYLSYRKGPFALYALSEYVGEEQVHKALRRLVENHKPKNAPLATTLDLYSELKAITPDSLQYLLHDLFEVNTYWQFDTETVTAKEIEHGNWQVTLEIKARKVVIDRAGVKKEVPMDEWIEVGVFRSGESNEESPKSLYLQKHRIKSGKQKITVTVHGKPESAGIDPRYLMIYLKEADNLKNVEMKGE